jgi:predicted cobalt transporter CbtA
MKTAFRIVISAVILALGVGLVVAAFVWLLGRNSVTQFVNGLFWSGTVFIAIGILAIVGVFRSQSNPEDLYSQPTSELSLNQRVRIWLTDITQSYHAFLFFSLTGWLLLGASFLLATRA